MTTLSDKAFAIMAVCEETKRPFGMNNRGLHKSKEI